MINGDIVFDYCSSMFNKYSPANDYKFFKVIGETKSYYKVNRINYPNHFELIRKSDLMIRGERYRHMHLLTNKEDWAYEQQYGDKQ